MTPEEAAALTKAINTFVREEILKAFTPLRERLDALESRGIEYVGVHQRAMAYRRGQCVTFDGSMFVCIADVGPGEDQPGNGGRWQLCVKRGERGQDGVQLRSPTRAATRVG
jgi:hypothetical protein